MRRAVLTAYGCVYDMYEILDSNIMIVPTTCSPSNGLTDRPAGLYHNWTRLYLNRARAATLTGGRCTRLE